MIEVFKLIHRIGDDPSDKNLERLPVKSLNDELRSINNLSLFQAIIQNESNGILDLILDGKIEVSSKNFTDVDQDSKNTILHIIAYQPKLPTELINKIILKVKQSLTTKNNQSEQ